MHVTTWLPSVVNTFEMFILLFLVSRSIPFVCGECVFSFTRCVVVCCDAVQCVYYYLAERKAKRLARDAAANDPFVPHAIDTPSRLFFTGDTPNRSRSSVSGSDSLPHTHTHIPVPPHPGFGPASPVASSAADGWQSPRGDKIVNAMRLPASAGADPSGYRPIDSAW